MLTKTYMSNPRVSEADGFAGGICVLRNSTYVDMELLSVDDQVVNCLVRVERDK